MSVNFVAFYFRQNTYFHERLMLPSDTEVPGKILLMKDNSLHLERKEFEALFRITKLTRVVLDERVVAQNAIPEVTVVAGSDHPEVKSARRALYE